MSTSHALCPALLAVVLAACASAAPSPRAPAGPARGPAADAPVLPSVPLPPELDRVLRDYEAAWGAGSADALARLFTDDGFVLQGGRGPARGRDHILRAYTGAGGKPLVLRALAFATDGNVGYIVGGYTGVAGAPDIGKFILLVRREPGGPWMIAADMDNGNGPPPGAPARPAGS